MSVDELIRLASNVGIPAILAAFVLVRLDAAIRALEIAQRGLSDRIEALLRRLDDGRP